MANTEQQPEDNRKLLTDLGLWADFLSKGVAGFAIALYACGFLIVSLHHSKYGFVSTNPFRPRILAAGAWFFFLSAIPVSVAIFYRQFSWIKIAQNLFPFWSSFWVLSLTLGLLFNLEYAQNTEFRSKWWLIVGIAIVVLLLAMNWKKAPPKLVAVASVTLVLIVTALELRRTIVEHSFQQETVTLWFVGAFLATLVELKTWTRKHILGAWTKPPTTIFIALLVFAWVYYPHIKASWGGGTPVRATIYFTKDSVLSPGKAVSAQLIEESDEGFYIVGANESKAIYIPRSAVALVYFSDKVADSSLLRDGK